MELRHLRYFLAVGEALNFTKAAAQLRVAQPALSRQVQDLEDEIGVDLLRRSPRGVTLTAEGKLVNSGVYKAGFSTTQAAYETAVRAMCSALEANCSAWTNPGPSAAARARTSGLTANPSATVQRPLANAPANCPIRTAKGISSAPYKAPAFELALSLSISTATVE